MAIRRKVSHHNQILSKEVRPLARVSFGDIIEFKYSGEKVYDLKPLVYILEKKGNLIKGINLNYLTEYTVQQLLQEAKRFQIREVKTGPGGKYSAGVVIREIANGKKHFQWYELYEDSIRTYKKNKMMMVHKVIYGKDPDAT